MATERRSASANHSNVGVGRVTRPLRACDTTQSTSTPRCRQRWSGRCSSDVLVRTVPRNPHQQSLILKTATFFRGRTQQPFNEKLLNACFKLFCNFGMMSLCRVDDFVHLHMQSSHPFPLLRYKVLNEKALGSSAHFPRNKIKGMLHTVQSHCSDVNWEWRGWHWDAFQDCNVIEAFQHINSHKTKIIPSLSNWLPCLT